MTTAVLDSPFGLDLTAHDFGAWGASLLYNAELVMNVLEVAGGASVTEVGALDGDLTRLLLLWAERSGSRVIAVDPSPHPDLETLARERAELDLIRQPSHAALAERPLSDTIILDGDHNYYTVSGELRIIAERASEQQRRLPLLLLHDVGWPHGRRDDYYVPEQIPAEHRQPIVPEGCLYPGEPGTRPGALPYHHPAAREGGPRNGVLTAVEDFVSDREELQLAIVPTFFGMALIWDRTMPEAGALTELLAGWDRNPHLERLEYNRALHLAETMLQLNAVREAERRLAEQRGQLDRQRQLLERMLQSRAFSMVERILRLRHPDPGFSRDAIRRVLDGHD
jgi:Methyltransferase domain